MKYGTIFSDMDGVVANFEKAVDKKVGMSITSKAWNDMNQGVRNKKYSEACDTVEFWANLETMPDFGSYWGYIKYWTPSILTAYPQWGNGAIEVAKKGKWIWNKKHTMVTEARFHCVKREEKQKFARTNGVPNILIDDMKKNIEEWNAAGGEGILHTSAVATITKLKGLGFKK
jgi:hypothetical protein